MAKLRFAIPSSGRFLPPSPCKGEGGKGGGGPSPPMIRRIWSLVIKEFIHLRTDWWMPAFMLIGGASELLLVGWATSRPISNLPLMVLDQDRTAASRLIVTDLENTGTFALATYAPDMQTIQNALDRGEINAAIVIPDGFARELDTSTGRPSLLAILNGAESVPADAALRAVQGVATDLDEKIAVKRLGVDPKTFAGFDPSLRVWFNEALSEALYTTPAELGLMLEFTVLLFAGLTFSRERELGTLEQLLVMPFSSAELILGKAIPVILVAFSALLLLLVLAGGYLLVELGKGMVISVISRTQHQAFLLVMLVGMVDFMFTGYAAPVESMPPILQQLANIIPAHHWLTILRGLLLKGAGLEVLWPHVVALVILGIVIGTFSLIYVRRALD
jgi:ABC-2 type transport system permease protein